MSVYRNYSQGLNAINRVPDLPYQNPTTYETSNSQITYQPTPSNTNFQDRFWSGWSGGWGGGGSGGWGGVRYEIDKTHLRIRVYL